MLHVFPVKWLQPRERKSGLAGREILTGY